MKRFARALLFIGLTAVVCVVAPTDAAVQTKWIALGGNGPANPYGIQVTETGPTVLRLQIGINGFNLENASESATKTRRVTLPGLTPVEEAGSPDLPRLVRALRIPDGTSPRVEIVEQKERTFENVQIDPSRGPIVIGQDPSKIKLVKGVPYKRDGFYPSNVFELIEPFQIRDTKGVKFVFSPFRYNPVQKQLKVTTRLVVDIIFDPISKTRAAETSGTNGRKHRRSQAFDLIEARLFLNGPTPPEAGGGPSGTLEAQATGLADAAVEVSSGDTMLIITTSTYSATLQSFIQWKQSQGINVVLDTTSAAGGVSAIQNTIQTQYDSQEGLTYVILVGNLQQVPSPLVTLISQKPSDPSYVALSGSNSVASAMISRILVDTVTELEIQLAKIMSYGQGPSGSDSWVNNALVGAEATSPNDAGEAGSIIDAMLDHPLNFTSALRVLSTDSNPSTEVINALENTGINMFTYVGHGTQTEMSSLSFTNTQASKLTDPLGAYPFVHTVACDLGDFTYTTSPGCFAESILNAGKVSAPAGAVAIAASTEDMYAGQGDIGQQIAFTNYYYSTQYETIGSLFFSSTAYAVSCLTGTYPETLYRQWHLFGDCSLPIQKISSLTPTASVTAPAQVNEGAGLLSGQGTVTLSQATTSALVVYLSSSSPNEASVPVSITVPAGVASAPFDIDVPDDLLTSGTQTVQICASISGWISGCSQMTILETGGQVSFSSSSYVAGSGSAPITLARAGGANGTISVNLQTSNGTATAGTNYTAQNMTVTFADGVTQQTVAIPIIADPYEQPAGTFNVSLTGAYAGSLNSAVVTIPANYSIDYFTEQGLSGSNLSFQSMSFIPNGSPSFYAAYVSPVSTFFTDPTGGTMLNLGDNSYAQVNLAGGATVSLYGTSYSTLFVGSNGYITFTAGDTTSIPSLQAQFQLPRISALFDDLDPSSGGSVSWQQLTDRVAVTFQNVPQAGTSNSNSFQVEQFFDGAIRITWLEIQASNALVGLSAGGGQAPPGFEQSILPNYGAYSWQVSLNLLGTPGSGSVNGNAGLLKSAGAVAIQTPLFFDLGVALSSSDSTRLTVPASITIPAGQTQAQFDLNVIANCTGDGSHTVTITALAQNSPAVQNSLNIIDSAIPGDLNGNCVVDYDDLVILLSYMGQPAQACPACDLDGDSVIDSGDVSLLESYCTCSGCVCPTTIQRTDPTLAQSVPALGKYGVGFLLAACVLILIGCANRLKNDGHGLK